MREISWRFSSSGNGGQVEPAGAQARLDVHDGDAQVEGGQRGGDAERCRRARARRRGSRSRASWSRVAARRCRRRTLPPQNASSRA